MVRWMPSPSPSARSWTILRSRPLLRLCRRSAKVTSRLIREKLLRRCSSSGGIIETDLAKSTISPQHFTVNVGSVASAAEPDIDIDSLMQDFDLEEFLST